MCDEKCFSATERRMITLGQITLMSQQLAELLHGLCGIPICSVQQSKSSLSDEFLHDQTFATCLAHDNHLLATILDQFLFLLMSCLMTCCICSALAESGFEGRAVS